MGANHSGNFELRSANLQKFSDFYGFNDLNEFNDFNDLNDP